MDADSLSSGSAAASSGASSAATSASSGAASMASAGSASLLSGSAKASASLASGSAQASSYAKGVAGDTVSKSSGLFGLSLSSLFTLFVFMGAAAYYTGNLDRIIAYIQRMQDQASGEKDRIMKENTDQTSVRAAAKDQLNAGTVRSEGAVNQMHAKAQEVAGVNSSSKTDGPLFSAETH